MLKRLFGIGIASSASTAVIAVQSLLLAKLLSTEHFGVTRLASSYMILLTMIGHFTLNNALASSIVKHRDSKKVADYIFSASVLVLAISILVTLIALGVILFTGHWDAQIRTPLAIVIISLPVVCLTLTYNACLDALGEYRTYVAVILTSAILPSLLLVIASAYWGLDGWLAARVLSAVLLLAVSLYAIRAYLAHFSFNRQYGAELFGFAKVQILSGILSLVLVSADVIMLERLTGDLTLVANYGVALLFFNACVFIPSALGKAYFRDIASQGAAGDRKKVEYLMVSLVAAVATAMALYWIGPLLIQQLFSDEYRPAQRIIKVMAYTVIFSFLWNSFSVINIAAGSPRNSVIISAVGASVGASMLTLLIPLYHGIGAALAMTAAYASGTLVGLVLFCRNHMLKVYQYGL